jgi:2-polyprenyl-3-methyl-5-hydroxy-6-metoxy-1,4-benzoquinol methylase
MGSPDDVSTYSAPNSSSIFALQLISERGYVKQFPGTKRPSESRRPPSTACSQVSPPDRSRGVVAKLACRLCGSEQVIGREWRGRYHYVQCVSCSLAFVANPPPEQEILEQYNRGASSKLAYYRMASPADARSFRALLEIIEQRSPKGTILDVGCNIGTFVRVAQERGWSAAGVDVNIEAVAFGKAEYGLNLMTLDEFESEPEQMFDVIHSSDTVEHFTDPTSAMCGYVRRLRPGGLLIVSTPNYDSRLCKIFQLKPTEHLFLFNDNSIRFMLRRIRLEVIGTLVFDRSRNISAMFESTTFDKLPFLKWLFKLMHRIQPELMLRLKGGENIVAIARAPDVVGGQPSR